MAVPTVASWAVASADRRVGLSVAQMAEQLAFRWAGVLVGALVVCSAGYWAFYLADRRVDGTVEMWVQL